MMAPIPPYQMLYLKVQLQDVQEKVLVILALILRRRSWIKRTPKALAG